MSDEDLQDAAIIVRIRKYFIVLM